MFTAHHVSGGQNLWASWWSFFKRELISWRTNKGSLPRKEISWFHKSTQTQLYPHHSTINAGLLEIRSFHRYLIREKFPCIVLTKLLVNYDGHSKAWGNADALRTNVVRKSINIFFSFYCTFFCFQITYFSLCWHRLKRLFVLLRTIHQH